MPKMTAPNLARVEELRGYIEGCSPSALMLGKQDEADLLAILDAYAAQLKAGATHDWCKPYPFFSSRTFPDSVGGDDEK